MAKLGNLMEDDIVMPFGLLRNNFSVTLPSWFGLESWNIIRCSVPTKKFDGEVSMVLNMPIMYSSDEVFDFSICIHDHYGAVVIKYNIMDASIVNVDIPNLDFSNDGILSAKVVLKYKACIKEKITN